MSMGDDLLAIIKDERKRREQDASRPIVDCPICGEILQKNSRGAVNCPLGHFRQSSDVRQG